MSYNYYDLNSAYANLTDIDSATASQNPNTFTLINNIQNADPGKFQEVAKTQLALLDRYRKKVLDQAQESFLWALIAALAGILLLFATIIIFLITRSLNVSVISGIGSIVIETVSGLIFCLRTQSLKQLAVFSESLVKVNYCVLANGLCESISNPQLQDTTRIELIRSMISNAASYSQVQYAPTPPPPDAYTYQPSTYASAPDPYTYPPTADSYTPMPAITRKL